MADVLCVHGYEWEILLEGLDLELAITLGYGT